jgi:hypothetical protein
MDLGDDDTRFEREDIPSHSHSEHSLEPFSLPITYTNSQHSVDPSQALPAFDGTLVDTVAFALPEPSSATFSSLTPLHHSISGNISTPDHTDAHNFSSLQQNYVCFQGQIVLPTDSVNIGPPNHTNPDNFLLQYDSSPSQIAQPILNQTVNQQEPAQVLTNKRAQKASTMSAKRWAPHKNRIRQLYVSEAKSLEELREIMNTELGISLT